MVKAFSSCLILTFQCYKHALKIFTLYQLICQLIVSKTHPMNLNSRFTKAMSLSSSY